MLRPLLQAPYPELLQSGDLDMRARTAVKVGSAAQQVLNVRAEATIGVVAAPYKRAPIAQLQAQASDLTFGTGAGTLTSCLPPPSPSGTSHTVARTNTGCKKCKKSNARAAESVYIPPIHRPAQPSASRHVPIRSERKKQFL